MEVSEQWSFSLGLSHSGARRSSNLSYHYLPSSKCISGIYILCSWQNSHTGFLTCGVTATMVRKAKRKPLKFSVSRNIENQNQYFFPGGITEISTTIKHLNDTGIVIPTASPSNLPMWPLQKTDGSCRMTVDYQKLKQVVTPIAAALSDVVSLLGQINTYPGTWYNY